MDEHQDYKLEDLTFTTKLDGENIIYDGTVKFIYDGCDGCDYYYISGADDIDNLRESCEVCTCPTRYLTCHIQVKACRNHDMSASLNIFIYDKSYKDAHSIADDAYETEDINNGRYRAINVITITRKINTKNRTLRPDGIHLPSVIENLADTDERLQKFIRLYAKDTE
jgi:hypothetical protein